MSGEKKSRERPDYYDYLTTALVGPGARPEPKVAVSGLAGQSVLMQREGTQGESLFF